MINNPSPRTSTPFTSNSPVLDRPRPSSLEVRWVLTAEGLRMRWSPSQAPSH